MPPRFLERMQTQAAMQKQWHRDPHSGPPSYQHLESSLPSENPPTYQRAQRSSPPPPAYREHQYSHLASLIDLHSFPDRSTILVVGAYTRQGIHIVDRLLDHHYRVRGVVSNSREAAHAAKHFEARHGRENYTSCTVPDMAVDGAFDLPARFCSGVIFVSSHAGSIMSTDVETLAKVTNALDSAMRQSNMHRFVFCSTAPTAKTTDQSLVHPMIRSLQDTNVQPRRSAPPYEATDLVPHGATANDQVSVEIAIWDWVDLCQPGFVLDLGESRHRQMMYAGWG